MWDTLNHNGGRVVWVFTLYKHFVLSHLDSNNIYSCVSAIIHVNFNVTHEKGQVQTSWDYQIPQSQHQQ